MTFGSSIESEVIAFFTSRLQLDLGTSSYVRLA